MPDIYMKKVSRHDRYIKGQNKDNVSGYEAG
jgi:hypothetical protein